MSGTAEAAVRGIVVVTGASSGIGEATARRFAADGFDVIGVARRADRLDALAASAGIRPVVADLTTEAGVAAVRDAVGDAPLRALINNAGGALGTERVEDAVVDDWRAMFETNVIATQRMIAALLPALRRGAAGEAGVADIVAITSIAGHVVYEGGGGYSAAKFAEHAMMAVLRLELGGEPIRVIEIAPGMVKTDFSLVRYKGDAAKADAVYEGVEHPLVAGDVAEAIVHAVELPGHVNLDLVTIKPVAQSAARVIARGPLRPRG